jgi:hypothetical protein
MTTAKINAGTRTQLSGAAAALNSLASATYVSVGTITFSSSGKTPLTDKLEVSVTPGTVSGNKQLLVFAQQSLDGTNFETGPVSGTTTTDEADLTFVGVVPLGTNSTLQRKVFDLAAAFGGTLPFAAKIIVRNDSGAALASSGNDVHYGEYTGDLT